MKISNKKMLAGWIAVMFMIAFTSVGFAGSIDPPSDAIDSGTGEPKPTMKTLDSIPGTWDRILPANDGPDSCHSSRFTCVLNDQAVRDNETGLVWERSPLTTTHDWEIARFQCTPRNVGGRRGWRLPLVHELASLADPGNPEGNPDLPVGHPFSNVQPVDYWSATIRSEGFENSWDVDFGSGLVTHDGWGDAQSVWCVRGGQNHGDVN